jgi:hypothetical protein
VGRLLVGMVALWAMGGCATAPPAEPAHGGKHPVARGHGGRTMRLSTTDVLGEPVKIGTRGQRHATVVFFMSKDSKEESAELGRLVDEKLVDRPVEQVAIVDMRKYGGMVRGMAESRLRKAAQDSRKDRRTRREAQHADASPEAVDRWHLIGDFDGSLFDRFGVGRNEELPVAFVVDRNGKLRGPYRQAATVLSAVDRAPGDKAPAHGKRRGSTLRAAAESR